MKCVLVTTAETLLRVWKTYTGQTRKPYLPPDFIVLLWQESRPSGRGTATKAQTKNQSDLVSPIEEDPAQSGPRSLLTFLTAGSELVLSYMVWLQEVMWGGGKCKPYFPGFWVSRGSLIRTLFLLKYLLIYLDAHFSIEDIRGPTCSSSYSYLGHLHFLSNKVASLHTVGPL